MKKQAMRVFCAVVILLLLACPGGADGLNNNGIRNRPGSSVATPTPAPTAPPTAVPTAVPTRAPTPVPTVSRTFEITYAYSNGDGSVTFGWTDSAGYGPYTAGYLAAVSNDPEDSYARGYLRWTLSGTFSGSSCTMGSLAPGRHYFLTLEDTFGTMIYYNWNPRESQYSEFKLKADVSPRIKSGKKTSKPKSFSLADIENNLDSKTFGAYIKLTYPQLKKKREFMATVVIELPNGDLYTDVYGDMDLPSGRTYTYWDFFDFTNMFKALNRRGALSKGTYTWRLYFDDEFACSDTFKVAK